MIAGWHHVRHDALAWTSSPSAGVERKMLERDGGEVAVATSFVRYGIGSAFPPHVHDGGEELVVLDGVFADEHGEYPVGTYVRNPPGSRHAPSSPGGCMIFVKLRQSHPLDQQRVCVQTEAAPLGQREVRTTLLHAFQTERVTWVRMGRGARLDLAVDEGSVEILVVTGSLEGCGERSWLWADEPPGPLTSPEGAALWIKRGHLRALRSRARG